MPQNDTEASLDGQLELKKRARRRLVGAAALALLAAIVLPMVMEREPRQPLQEVQIKIPGQDAGGIAARILPKKQEATPLPPIEPDAKADVKRDAQADAKPETRPETQAETKPEPKVEAKSESKPDVKAKAIEKPAVKPADKSKEKAVPNKAEEARALAALSGNAAAADLWVVQLGAYKEEGRVKQLVSKLKQMNVPVFTEHVDTAQGPRTRVRAGPFKDKTAAEQAQVKVRKIGIDGPVAPK